MVLKKIFLFLLAVSTAFYDCSFHPEAEKLDIKLNPNYPRWLKSGNYSTNQTSGISFIGYGKDSNKIFLLADDVGKIHLLKIKDDTLFSFTAVNFSKNVQAYLDSFPKADFEDLTFDKYTGNVYISIEGNNPHFQKYAGIYKLTFKNNDILSNEVINIEKLDIKPQYLFLKYTKNNIGYEGLAVDKDYFYFGLEGFTEQGIFTDNTIILIVDKKSKKIIKKISTKPFGIHTVCGLYSDKDFSVYGIDRNNKKIFHLDFDNFLNVEGYSLVAVHSNIPNYLSYDYVSSLESITMDNENNLFLTDDPWKKFFVPSKEILNKLDSLSIKNFKRFVPIIYEFKIKN